MLKLKMTGILTGLSLLGASALGADLDSTVMKKVESDHRAEVKSGTFAMRHETARIKSQDGSQGSGRAMASVPSKGSNSPELPKLAGGSENQAVQDFRVERVKTAQLVNPAGGKVANSPKSIVKAVEAKVTAKKSSNANSGRH